MRFHVNGVRRETAEPVELVLDCATPTAAEEQANRMGVLVERIEPALSSQSERTNSDAHAQPSSRSAAHTAHPDALLSNVRLETDRGELETRASIGRLGRLAPNTARAYAGWWKHRRAITALSHVCIVLASGWVYWGWQTFWPRTDPGVFPPLAELTEFLGEEGYFQDSAESVPAVIRARSARKVTFMRNAHTRTGIINVYCDLTDDQRAIAIVLQYHHYTLREMMQMPDPASESGKLGHSTAAPFVIKRLTGINPDFVELLDDESGWGTNHKVGYDRSGGFSVEVQRWGEDRAADDKTPNATNTPADYAVIVLDRSFDTY